MVSERGDPRADSPDFVEAGGAYVTCYQKPGFADDPQAPAASDSQAPALQRLDRPVGDLEAAGLEQGGLVGNVTRHRANPRRGSPAPANSRKIALRPEPEGIA